jgi:hypothetical protein
MNAARGNTKSIPIRDNRLGSIGGGLELSELNAFDVLGINSRSQLGKPRMLAFVRLDRTIGIWFVFCPLSELGRFEIRQRRL